VNDWSISLEDLGGLGIAVLFVLELDLLADRGSAGYSEGVGRWQFAHTTPFFEVQNHAQFCFFHYSSVSHLRDTATKVACFSVY